MQYVVATIWLLLTIAPAASFQNIHSFSTCSERSHLGSSGVRKPFVSYDWSPPSTSTSLNSFMGSDGGILGIGTPELFTILLVGYFVLGPSDLYKLVKSIGSFVSNIRSLGTEATKTFESNMESSLQLDEIRKAQRELNDAFSFRRTINTDENANPFDVPDATVAAESESAAVGATAATTAAAVGSATTKKKKRIRRRKKAPAAVEETLDEVNGAIPDLSVKEAVEQPTPVSVKSPAGPTEPATKTESEVKLDKEKDWFEDSKENDFKMPSVSEMVKEEKEWLQEAEVSPQQQLAEQQRFQSQLNNGWNQRVMENEDDLAPLAMIMERLALLEDEKAAADKRLEEEFRLRAETEEKFYREKRKILEDSAIEVQSGAYIDPTKK